MIDEEILTALKIAFTFMPHPVDITKFEYGDDADRIRDQVNYVREILLSQGVDPDEVQGDINPDSTPNSCY
ncbi:MAG: hypothetical protein LRY63_14090 [Nitrincola sp.]|nr:hypothetical protein [Nitrincola sp.]